MTSVCNRCAGADGGDRLRERRFHAVEVHPPLPADLHRLGRGELLPLEVAVHEDVHLARAVDPQAIVAAVEVQVRAGQGHAAAFKVGRLPAGLSERLSEDVNHRARPVGVDHLQMIAGDEDRLLTRIGRLRLANADVLVHIQFGQFAPPLVQEQELHPQQSAEDLEMVAAGRVQRRRRLGGIGRHWRPAGDCRRRRLAGVWRDAHRSGIGRRWRLAGVACGRRRAGDSTAPRPGAAGWNHASSWSTAPESWGEFIFTLPRANIRSG